MGRFPDNFQNGQYDESQGVGLGTDIAEVKELQPDDKPEEVGIDLEKMALEAPAIKEGPEVQEVEIGDESTNNPPVVVELDFFKSSSTKALNRGSLFDVPALFAKKKCSEQISDEVYDRFIEFNFYADGKNVFLKIYISRKDIASSRRLKTLQQAIYEVNRLANLYKVKHSFIFDPLDMEMKVIFS